VADFLDEARDALARELHRVEALERGQPELQRGGSQVIARGRGVLHHELQPLEAHEIAVRLGGAHAGSLGEVAQHQRAGCLAQHAQQPEAHFHRLDAGALFHPALPQNRPEKSFRDFPVAPVELRLGKFISQCVTSTDSSAFHAIEGRR
jgi:hypothetical protein